MKTFDDFMEEKKKPMRPFASLYEWDLAWLEDQHIAKINGDENIKRWLADWDLDARAKILSLIAERVARDGGKLDLSEFSDVLGKGGKQ